MTKVKEDTRIKILDLVKELVFSEQGKGNAIPQAVRKYLLQNYCWELTEQTGVTSQVSTSEIDDFAEKLEALIEDRYQIQDDIQVSEMPRLENVLKQYEKYKITRTEYIQVMLDSIAILKELVVFKEKYSSFLKIKSIAEEIKIEVLEKKLEFLKQQALYKLYGESNSIKAHIKLKNLLLKHKRELEIKVHELIELQNNYDKLKNDKDYLKVLKSYKQVIQQAKKLDFIFEI